MVCGPSKMVVSDDTSLLGFVPSSVDVLNINYTMSSATGT